jgi:hypothetical protein
VDGVATVVLPGRLMATVVLYQAKVVEVKF